MQIDKVAMELRIATYNIHKGASIDHRPVIQELKRSIRSLSADVIFLQEVQGRHDLMTNRHALLWQDRGQHAYLAGNSLYCAYGKNAVYDHGHHGNALLSAYPIVSQCNTDVSDHALESRGILHCVLQTPETKVYCYVIHLGLFNGSRIRQTYALIDTVRRSAPDDAPVIIAGDFNDWNNNLSDLLRKTLRVKEVFDELSGQDDRKKPFFPGLTARFPNRCRREHFLPCSLFFVWTGFRSGDLWSTLQASCRELPGPRCRIMYRLSHLFGQNEGWLSSVIRPITV